MNKVLIGVLILIAGGALFFGGLFLGQADATGFSNSWMRGGDQWGPDFMDREQGFAEYPCGTMDGVIGRGYGSMYGGYGMMGESGRTGRGYGMMGNRAGMMDGFGYTDRSDVEPLSIEDTETALSKYLASLGKDSLAIGEIMIFDNHAYAQIVDSGSDKGAFEVLVDPVSLDVYPEPGPNMMWNTEYGHMSGFGAYGGIAGKMGRGMMGGFVADTEIDVTGQEAITIAQQYLDKYLGGTTADETADVFPGYYTIHVLRDGETVGMLSVNARTGQVFLHQWHGDFIEMTGDQHD